MKRGKRFAAALLATAMLLGCLSGCGSSNTSASSSAAASTTQAASSKITITDIDGKEYSFDKALDKVVIQWSGSGGPFMIMAALFGEEFTQHIAGMDNGLYKNRKDMYDSYVKDLPAIKDIPIVGSADGDDFNLEKVISSGADAMIVPVSMKSSLSETIQPKLEAAGIPVIYMDYHAETMENHIKSTEMMGKLFGKEEKAAELVKWYKSHMDALNSGVEAALKANNNTRPSVYIECCSKGKAELGNSYGNNYMWGAMVYSVGGTSIADGKVTKYSPLEKEYVLSSNPDIIIFTGSIWAGATDYVRMGFDATEEDTNKRIASVLSRDGWNEISAVKNNRVYAVHHALGRELYDVASFEALAKDIWPEQFKDLDPSATLKEYYDKYLPFKYSGLWFMKYGG